MDEPSREPASSPPPSEDDGPFWIVLFAPIVLFVFALLLSDGRGNAIAPNVLLSLAGFFAMVSPILCGLMVGARRGLGVGVLTFIGVLMLYVAIAFAGCMWMVRGLSH